MAYQTPDAIGSTEETRLATVSIDDFLRAALTGAVFDLTDAENWEQRGAMTPDECAAYFQTVFWDFMSSGLIGLILPYATSSVPSFALPCDGATYNKATNPEYERLYGALDAVFLIDADNFYLPDLRDSFVLGASATYAVGATGGTATETLVTSEMPSHSHTDLGHTHAEGIALPAVGAAIVGVPIPSAVPGLGVTGVGAAALTNTGGDGAHNNMPPYLALKMCIVYK